MIKENAFDVAVLQGTDPKNFRVTRKRFEGQYGGRSTLR